MTRLKIKGQFAFAGLAAALALSGCAGRLPLDNPFEAYAQRIETITPTAGDDVAVNEATQVITPWPSYVHNTRIPGNSARLVRAVSCFEGQANPSKDATGCEAKAATTGSAAASQ